MPDVYLQIRRLPHGEGVELPAQMSAGAAGFDLHAACDDVVELPPGEIRLVPCGFQMALPIGFEAQVRPRSGLASKHGITLPNTPGTIDADYRGEVLVPLINLGKASFTVERGMRIAQMVIQRLPTVEMRVVDELPTSDRGSDGFGSTGV
ncbi:MAG: dUTP diphosphatase [Planctomycetota bacterium]